MAPALTNPFGTLSGSSVENPSFNLKLKCTQRHRQYPGSCILTANADTAGLPSRQYWASKWRQHVSQFRTLDYVFKYCSLGHSATECRSLSISIGAVQFCFRVVPAFRFKANHSYEFIFSKFQNNELFKERTKKRPESWLDFAVTF